MKKCLLVILLLAGCVILMGVSEKRTQWEYGHFEHRFIDKDTQMYTWFAKPPIVGKSSEEFCQQIGHPSANPLDALGTEGWEMISVSVSERKYEIIESYWFKRQK